MRRLLIRPGAIGDVIVSLPALEFLRTGYTEVWTPSRTVPLIRFADRVCSIASTGLDMLEIDPPPRLVARLGEFDEIWSWYGAGRAALIERLGPRARVCPALPDGTCHACDFFLRQVGAPDGGIPRIDVPPVAREFTVIQPFASSPAKRWPLDRFRAVAEKFDNVRWLAGPEEELDGAVRIEDLYELACWLARAKVYIGNDSGITHLAAAVGTPVVALFGPTDSRVWLPRGNSVTVLRQDASTGDACRAIDTLRGDSARQ